MGGYLRGFHSWGSAAETPGVTTRLCESARLRYSATAEEREGFMCLSAGSGASAQGAAPNRGLCLFFLSSSRRDNTLISAKRVGIS